MMLIDVMKDFKRRLTVVTNDVAVEVVNLLIFSTENIQSTFTQVISDFIYSPTCGDVNRNNCRLFLCLDSSIPAGGELRFHTTSSDCDLMDRCPSQHSITLLHNMRYGGNFWLSSWLNMGICCSMPVFANFELLWWSIGVMSSSSSLLIGSLMLSSKVTISNRNVGENPTAVDHTFLRKHPRGTSLVLWFIPLSPNTSSACFIRTRSLNTVHVHQC